MHKTKSIVLSAAILMAFSVVGCNKGVPSKAKLDNAKAKYSYAIGHQIASNIKNQKVDLDKASFMAAMERVLTGKDPQMKDDEMRTALQEMAREQRESRSKESDANMEKGKAYLETNKKKEGVKVTESGLQYRVLKDGSGKKPTKDNKVKVHYKGTLTDGTAFDSSYDRGEPAEFPVMGVIQGWQEGLQLMNVGSKYEFVIPAGMAYGSQPRPKIPGNSVLVFEVELIDIVK